MNIPKKDKPISMLTASLDKIKYNVRWQPNALKPAPSFLKQEAEKKLILANTLDNNKIYN